MRSTILMSTSPHHARLLLTSNTTTPVTSNTTKPRPATVHLRLCVSLLNTSYSPTWALRRNAMGLTIHICCPCRRATILFYNSGTAPCSASGEVRGCAGIALPLVVARLLRALMCDGLAMEAFC